MDTTSDNKKKENIGIIYSDATGRSVFEGLAIQSQKLASTPYHLYDTIKCDDAPTQPKFTMNEGHKIDNCQHILAILSQDSLSLPSYVWALERACEGGKTIILVHDPSSPFPSESQLPEPIKHIFYSIAIRFRRQYANYCWDKIINRLNKLRNRTTPVDVSTDIFLSHKQSTGQGIALALYQSLQQKGLNVFLDVRAEFDLHDLSQIVTQTNLFIFIISEGIFSSQWCFKEFKSAMERGRPILVVKAADYSVPLDSLPPNWAPYQNYFIESKVIDYDPYFLNECIEQIINKSSFLNHSIKTIETILIEIYERLLNSLLDNFLEVIIHLTNSYESEANKHITKKYSNFGAYRVSHFGFVGKAVLSQEAQEVILPKWKEFYEKILSTALKNVYHQTISEFTFGNSTLIKNSSIKPTLVRILSKKHLNDYYPVTIESRLSELLSKSLQINDLLKGVDTKLFVKDELKRSMSGFPFEAVQIIKIAMRLHFKSFVMESIKEAELLA